jgi:hypothetical protein
MTITRKITAMTTAAALAFTAMAPLATTASAEGYRDGRHGGPEIIQVRGEKRDWNRGERNFRRGDQRDWKRNKRHAKRYNHWDDRRHHRRHKRDNTGKYIALGIGALMLGIIASEASRR